MHYRIPRGLVHFAKGGVARDAGVVDQHVNRPALGLNFCHGGLARLEIRDVNLIRLEFEALFFHVGKPLVALGVARRAGGDDLVAHACEFDTDGLAQASHAAGDDRSALCHGESPVD